MPVGLDTPTAWRALTPPEQSATPGANWTRAPYIMLRTQRSGVRMRGIYQPRRRNGEVEMGNWLGIAIIVAMFAFVGIMGYIRIAPSDVTVWHVDPTAPALGTTGGSALVRADGDLQSPVFPETPEALLARLDAVAMGTPRTRQFAGSVADGRITYLSRSLFFGFPDYISVTTVPAEGGAQVVAYGRLRFGSSDMGVNAERLESWLGQLGT